MTEITLSEKQIARRRRNSEQAINDMRLEGLEPPKEAVDVMELYINGKITMQERHVRMMKLVSKHIEASN